MSLIEQEINNITDGIFADYAQKKFIDKFDITNQPDKKVITDILVKLQEIIFPGFFKPDTYKTYTVKSTVSMLVEDVLYNLKKEIAITLKYNPVFADSTECEVDGESQRIAIEFLKRIPKMREYIETDVSAAFDGDPAAYNREEIVETYPGFYAIMVNRIAHELHLLGVPLIPRIMTEHAHSLTVIDIHPGATIGKYFFIDH